MANETKNKDSWKQTYRKKVSLLQEKYKNPYNWTIRLLPYVVILVGAVVGGRVWQAYLSYPERCTDLDVLLKGSIESSLFANIILMMGLLYLAFLFFVHVCLYRPGWWHIPVYVILATYLCVIPLWNPIDTAIPGLSYPILLTTILAIIGVCELAVLIFRLCTKEALKELSDGSDGFIVKANTDEMVATGWEDFIDRIFSMVGEKQLEKESFAIGIAGSWGSGKTTFYDAMKQKIKQDNKFVLCEFKPWQILEPARIAPEFFAEFTKAIRQDSKWESQLQKSIARYAQILTEVPQLSGWAQIINTCLLFYSKETVAELRAKVESLLDNQKTYVAVMIDDLDRLNKDELLEIMRLVRASANFKHVLFILVYDKEHFVKELENKDDVEYLKKIVNVEINLPLIENFKYRDLLLKHIQKTAPDLHTSQLEELKKIWLAEGKKIRSILLNTYSRNFRDLVRFSNHFGLILKHLQKQEILDKYDIQDLFWLEMLHYYEEGTYNQLLKPCWTLLKKEEDPKTKQLYLTLTESTVKSDISGLDILYMLFNPDRRKSVNSIVWRNNFNNYLAHQLLKNAISMTEFSTFVEKTKDPNKIDTKVIEWDKGHTKISLLQAVNNYPHNNVFVSELAVRNYVGVLFKLLEIKAINTDELKKYVGMKSRLSYFRKIDTKSIEKLLPQAIARGEGIRWNHLLTAMCLTEDDTHVINHDRLVEAAKLNYEKCFKGEIMPLTELFNQENAHMQFIMTLSYVRREKYYGNLLGDCLLEKWHPSVQSALGNKEFNYIYSNLKKLSEVSGDINDEEQAVTRMQQTIESTLDSLDNFECLINTYFKLNKRNTSICENIGLNVPSSK